MSLSRYTINPVTGFVPATPPLASLPEPFAPWERVVPELSALIRSRRIRSVLQNLPLLDTDVLTTSAQRERALLILSVFGNAHVWAGEEPQLSIVRSVAIPLCAVARALDRPPIAHYASMALNNWQLLDPEQPVSADNARMQVQFLGGVDEDWFFMGSLGVELTGAPLLPLIQLAAAASLNQSDAELRGVLEALAFGMTAVHKALHRMREWCDPHTYYMRVRPFLGGWPAPGVVYEGVSPEPQQYVGGSAGQSSLIQALDAVLGVDHGDTAAGRYLRLIRAYMPAGHRAFVVDIERSSRVRARVSLGSAGLREVYNAALNQIELFRQMHTALARDFILKPSGANPDEQGTGGTTFTEFLRATELATTRSKL